MLKSPTETLSKNQNGESNHHGVMDDKAEKNPESFSEKMINDAIEKGCVEFRGLFRAPGYRLPNPSGNYKQPTVKMDNGELRLRQVLVIQPDSSLETDEQREQFGLAVKQNLLGRCMTAKRLRDENILLVTKEGQWKENNINRFHNGATMGSGSVFTIDPGTAIVGTVALKNRTAVSVHNRVYPEYSSKMTADKLIKPPVAVTTSGETGLDSEPVETLLSLAESFSMRPDDAVHSNQTSRRVPLPQESKNEDSKMINEEDYQRTHASKVRQDNDDGFSSESDEALQKNKRKLVELDKEGHELDEHDAKRFKASQDNDECSEEDEEYCEVRSPSKKRKLTKVNQDDAVSGEEAVYHAAIVSACKTLHKALYPQRERYGSMTDTSARRYQGVFTENGNQYLQCVLVIKPPIEASNEQRLAFGMKVQRMLVEQYGLKYFKNTMLVTENSNWESWNLYSSKEQPLGLTVDPKNRSIGEYIVRAGTAASVYRTVYASGLLSSEISEGSDSCSLSSVVETELTRYNNESSPESFIANSHPLQPEQESDVADTQLPPAQNVQPFAPVSGQSMQSNIATSLNGESEGSPASLGVSSFLRSESSQENNTMDKASDRDFRLWLSDDSDAELNAQHQRFIMQRKELRDLNLQEERFRASIAVRGGQLRKLVEQGERLIADKKQTVATLERKDQKLDEALLKASEIAYKNG